MSNKTLWVRVTMVIATLAAPLPALAQSKIHPVIDGLGGVTFGSVKGGSFDSDLGVDVNPHLRISADFGRLTNILPATTRDAVAAQANTVASVFGNTATATEKLSASTFGGLVTLRSSEKRHVTGYLDGGLGAARLTGSLAAKMMDSIGDASDISSEVVFPLLEGTSTKAMFSAGGGVTINLDKRLGLDVGYRYGRVLGANPVDTGRVYSGLQFRF